MSILSLYSFHSSVKVGKEEERAGGGGRRGVEERRWWKNLERESVVGGRKKMMRCLKSMMSWQSCRRWGRFDPFWLL